jgi:hypothetical protein
MADLKWLAFGCTHAPITHQGYWEWLLDNIAEFQPDYLIHLGDGLEAQIASRWGKDPRHDWKLSDELREFESQIGILNALVPKAKKVFLYGNHDSNLLHGHDRLNEETQALVAEKWEQIRNGVMSDWLIPNDYYRHESYWRLGQITFQHGCNTGKAQIHSHLHKQGVQYGVPYGLHVSAHTHSAVAVHQMVWLDQPMPYWVANVGTGADWDRMFYMDRASKSLWSRGLVRGTVSKHSATKCNSAYTKPQWTAETLFHSFAGNKFDVRLKT